jgi:hypothetical protein
MSSKKNNPKRVVTPTGRVSYANVFEPRKQKNPKPGEKPKYGMDLIFDSKTDLKPLRLAVKAAIVEKFGPDKTKWPKNIKRPFKDGNEKSDQEGYAGKIYISPTSNNKPGVIDRDGVTHITQESGDFYSGCSARAAITAGYYDTSGNKGVTFYLDHVQKMKDGEAFSGRGRPEDVFDAVGDADDEDDDQDGDDEDFDIGG